MRHLRGHRSVIAFLVAAALAPACASSSPPPPAPPPPPPPPPAATAIPPAPPPSAAPAPAPTGSAAAPTAPRKHPGHPFEMAGRLFVALDAVELRAEQKPAIDSIEADLEKLRDAAKEPRQKLVTDIADGVAAGKIDKAKTDADIRALGTAVAGTTPTVQDAINRLYKTLDAEQRKKLVEALRNGHGMQGMGPGMQGGMGPGMQGMGPGMQGGMGPGMHGPAGGGPAPGKPGGAGSGAHEGMGPGGGMGPGMHGRMLEKLSTDLGLTPEQTEKLKTKLDAQMKANQAAMKAKAEAAQQHLKALADAFEGDKFDAKKAGVGTQAPDFVKEMAKHHLEFVQTVLSVLTPEQRAKFAEHIRAHAAAAFDAHGDDDAD